MNSDSGISLVEVVIAMFLFALIALGMLPGIITGLERSADNVTLTAASDLVRDRVNEAQSAGTACDDIASLAGSEAPVLTRGVQIARTTSVGHCPGDSDSYPAAILLQVSVVSVQSSAPIATASTLVYVDEP